MPFIFYDVFGKFQNKNRMKVLYFRFVSAAMYLVRGATNNQYFGKESEVEENARKEHIEEVNERIKRQYRECIANIKRCCILIQQWLPVSALNPNLHAWRCMIPYIPHRTMWASYIRNLHRTTGRPKLMHIKLFQKCLFHPLNSRHFFLPIHFVT